MRASINHQLQTGATAGTLAEGALQPMHNPQDTDKAHTVLLDATGVNVAGFLAGTWNRFTVATIRWFVDGNVATRKVSVLHGQAISGVGKSVTVTVTDQSLNPAGAPPQNYNVSVLVAPGTRASNGGYPVLYPSIAPPVLAPGGSVSVPIDPDAGAAAFRLPYLDMGGPFAYVDGNLSVAFLFGATTLEQYDPRVQPGWVPIPPGATSVLVTNNSGARTYQVTPIFGIDG